jgi:hypothetical protein
VTPPHPAAAQTRRMPLGPLQILVVSFEETHFRGEVETELLCLHDAGILRVIDLVFVAKSPEGDVQILETGAIHSGELGQALLGLDGGGATLEGVDIADEADVWCAADAIEPGGAAAIAVVEHRWAIPLGGAITRAGGRTVVAEWADEEDLAGLGVALAG